MRPASPTFRSNLYATLVVGRADHRSAALDLHLWSGVLFGHGPPPTAHQASEVRGESGGVGQIATGPLRGSVQPGRMVDRPATASNWRSLTPSGVDLTGQVVAVRHLDQPGRRLRGEPIAGPEQQPPVRPGGIRRPPPPSQLLPGHPLADVGGHNVGQPAQVEVVYEVGLEPLQPQPGAGLVAGPPRPAALVSSMSSTIGGADSATSVSAWATRPSCTVGS